VVVLKFSIPLLQVHQIQEAAAAVVELITEEVML
jgi:hypothetical protein